MELQDMDTMNPEYVMELALNKLEQIQHWIDELKEQHKHLLSEQNEVIKFIPKFWFIVFKSNFFLKYCFVEDDDDINKNMFNYLVSLTVEDDEELLFHYACEYGEILRSRGKTVPSKVSKIIIFVYVLIKYCVCFDKMFVGCCKMCVVL